MTKKASKNTIAVFSITLAAMISGLVWYRIGQFVGSSSQYLRRMNVDHDEPFYHASATNNNEYYRPKTRGGSSFIDDGSNGNILQDAVKVDDNSADDYDDERKDHDNSADLNLPYKCGIVFFYHIPSTGGASINTWLRKYANPKKGYNYTYYQHWEADFKGKREKDIATVVRRAENTFMKGMATHVQNLRDDEWRIAHAHINSLYINETEHLLYQWREAVENQGCHMINTIMLRDPLNHAMSLHKVIPRKNSNLEEWIDYLNQPTGRGLWATNLDFVLYNKGRRNPYNVTKEVKVKRAMEILERHFDVVTVGNHNLFMNEVLKRTGWDYIKMPYTNSFKGELTFTKKRVESLQKLLAANGDTEFMDAVRKRYHGYLSYLDK